MRYVLFVSAFLISACAAPQQSASGCGAVALQSFVGAPVVEVASIDTGGPVRILSPGMALTGNANPERLNIFADQRSNVVALRCG